MHTSGKSYMQRFNPPFRAENVGSFLRPVPLYTKRKAIDADKNTFDVLKSVEDQAIEQVVKLQRSLAIKTITDGELRR